MRVRPTFANAVMRPEDPIPVACQLGEMHEASREAHLRLGRELLGRKATARVEHGHGVAFRLHKSELMDVATFVETETRCCTFMTITLRLDAASNDLWLEFDGPDGTRDVLVAELGLCNAGCDTSTCEA